MGAAKAYYQAVATNGPFLNFMATSHVVVGPPDFVDLTNGLVMETIANAPITVTQDYRGTRLSNPYTAIANVLGGGVQASNGVMYTIDNVLLPTSWGDILTAVRNSA